jgi:catechol 2,3-dioxygenase-like lactoylglutathione lyase family enzyme
LTRRSVFLTCASAIPINMNTIKRVAPNIKSTRMDESRAFYVDFLGLKLGMDLGFVMTFISPNDPTAQISVVRDEGASTL